MNYLAHAFLSDNDSDLLIGNFIADHVRGSDLSIYSPPIVRGIKLHRGIDSYTDQHPLFRSSKRLFYDGFERHSGILIDIYFDHLLAKNFASYHDEPLDIFSKKVYAVYNQYKHLLPERSQSFLGYVITNNIYTSYAGLEGIRTVLFNLSRRFKHGVRLDDSVKVFEKNEGLLQQNFTVFFEQLQQEVNSLIRGSKS
jgi:acyl carrier protein phosphodiesterase